jgi:hypothetical protein
MFPPFYGKADDSYYMIASKSGTPEHSGWYRNILGNSNVHTRVLRRLRGQGGQPGNPRGRPRSRALKLGWSWPRKDRQLPS